MNVYADPNKFNLQILGQLDEPDMSYSYNTLVVFRHVITGRMFYAQDSGCSCPTPFDDFRFDYAVPDIINTNLHEIRPDNSFDDFECRIRSFPVSLDNQMRLLWQVKAILRVA